MNAAPDPLIFSEANIHRQLQTAPFTQGFYTLRFYTENGKPAAHPTDTISEFYLYPSGGTLRDSDVQPCVLRFSVRYIQRI